MRACGILAVKAVEGYVAVAATDDVDAGWGVAVMAVEGYVAVAATDDVDASWAVLQPT